MVDYFLESEHLKAKSQKTKVLIAYFIILGIYLFVSIGLFLWYLTLPYMSPTITTVKLIHYPLTAVMIIFSFVY